MLRPGEIFLIEGNQRISAAIKYLTQSTWSTPPHIGDWLVRDGEGGRMLVECGVENGCIAVPLAKYANFNTRICRPVGLSKDDRDTIIDFMVSSIGLQYDTKNIFDLARYLLPTPPVPVRWRRRMWPSAPATRRAPSAPA